METFFILLAIVFIPFIWFIVRMLRFTDETIGENSPLYKIRTYEVSFNDYFFTFEKIGWAVCAFMMLLLSKIMVDAALTQEPLLWLFVLTFAAGSALFVSLFYVDWQYWLITRGVKVILDPIQPAIIVDSPSTYNILTPDNILRIEEHRKDPGKVSRMLADYGYFLIYTKDGHCIPINFILLGGFVYTEFVERFFSTVPRTTIWHKSAWPSELDNLRMSKSPNFATPNQR
jgi:hypothetical protein